MYPKECFCYNINTTKLAKKAYEDKQAKIEKLILEKYPNYHSLNLREQYNIRKEIRNNL
jgi:hypothetical protein